MTRRLSISFLLLLLAQFALIVATNKIGGVKVAPAGNAGNRKASQVSKVNTHTPTHSSDSGSESSGSESDQGDTNCDECSYNTITSAAAAASTAIASSTSLCNPSDTACNNCGIAWQTIYACADVYYPYWSEFNAADMAACLCYNPSPTDISSLVWVPNQFDAPWDYCPDWASTADPYDYSFYLDSVDFCTQMGNVLSDIVFSTDLSVDDLAAAATTSDVATSTHNSIATNPSSSNSQSSSSTTTSSLLQPAAIVLIGIFAGVIIVL